MRRKRLQHAADTLCKMFCGWRLDSSKASLARLGSGTIEVDTLTGDCSFEGKPIESLPIVRELQAWLRDDLRTHSIPIEELKAARLRARLLFSLIPWSERRKKAEIFYRDGRTVCTGQVHRCEIECEREIATDEALYRSRLQDFEEWPTEWP